jgi:hypothetical protein
MTKNIKKNDGSKKLSAKELDQIREELRNALVAVKNNLPYAEAMEINVSLHNVLMIIK